MFKEFREFIMRGNVIDLAVAFVIGAAFGAIVSSLMKDIIMPVVGYALGGIDFTNMFVVLGGASYAALADAQKAGAATIN
jgi:large conductance mechanosensitive channel